LDKATSDHQQPIIENHFNVIKVFNEVASDHEGTCYSSEDDEDFNKVDGDDPCGVYNLLWYRKEGTFED
jgi:hypothetical protein